MDRLLIQDICMYLLDNIDRNVSSDELEQVFHYNKFYLIRQFKEYTGLTPVSFINECRVYNSIDPLIFTKETILYIALNNHFNGLEQYSNKFKNVMGVSPSKFRALFSSLIVLAEKTDDIKELDLLKDVLGQINEYKEYLMNTEGDLTILGAEPVEKPKVYQLSKENYKTKNAA